MISILCGTLRPFWDQLKYLSISSGSAPESISWGRTVIKVESLRWVLSSDQCCLAMRSEMNGTLIDCGLGLSEMEIEEQSLIM